MSGSKKDTNTLRTQGTFFFAPHVLRGFPNFFRENQRVSQKKELPRYVEWSEISLRTKGSTRSQPKKPSSRICFLLRVLPMENSIEHVEQKSAHNTPNQTTCRAKNNSYRSKPSYRSSLLAKVLILFWGILNFAVLHILYEDAPEP